MDFLRTVALYKGRVIFVEDKASWFPEDGQDEMQRRSRGTGKLAQAMLMCLAHVYRTTAYETYTLIKSQNLFFRIEAARLNQISSFSSLIAKATNYLATFP